MGYSDILIFGYLDIWTFVTFGHLVWGGALSSGAGAADPYEGIGGVRFRLNDFAFTGTGVPFVPYTPTNWMETTNADRPF